MSSLSKLDYKMDYLVVRNTDGVKRIHLSEISVLMIESTAVSLTAYLLCELNKRKIDIIFCDERRLPYGMLLPLYGSHNASLKLREQIQWKDPVKAARFAAEQQRLYEVHGKANILHDPYYNPNLTMDREDFSESDDLRGLKEGRITVQWRE